MEEIVLSPYGYELQNGLLVQSDTGEVIPYSVMALPEKSTVNTPLEKELRGTEKCDSF